MFTWLCKKCMFWISWLACHNSIDKSLKSVVGNVFCSEIRTKVTIFFQSYMYTLWKRCSAGKCRIAGKRHNLRKMSHRRREMSQSAENVVNPIAGICRIVDGKCRKKFAAGICRNIETSEMSQLLLILHLDYLLKRKQKVIKYTCIWIAYIKLIVLLLHINVFDCLVAIQISQL